MRLSPLFAAGLLAMTIGLAASCYWSGYDPVLRYHAAMESALQNPVRRVEYLRAAASADPLSAEPWNALAGLALAEWQQTADAHFPKELGGVDAANLLLRLVGQYTAAAIQRAPNDCQLRSAAASRYDAVFERTKNRVQLQRGIEHYQAAIRLYPNKAEYHARLALDMVKLGDSNSANEEAETALWLDDANPHRDKKLDPKLRKSMERIVSKRN
jgi:hypothetical protein